jgi:hypothetical protein
MKNNRALTSIIEREKTLKIRNLLMFVEEVLLQADDVLALVVVDQTHRLETWREWSTDNQSCGKILNYRRLRVE